MSEELTLKLTREEYDWLRDVLYKDVICVAENAVKYGHADVEYLTKRQKKGLIASNIFRKMPDLCQYDDGFAPCDRRAEHIIAVDSDSDSESRHTCSYHAMDTIKSFGSVAIRVYEVHPYTEAPELTQELE